MTTPEDQGQDAPAAALPAPTPAPAAPPRVVPDVPLDNLGRAMATAPLPPPMKQGFVLNAAVRYAWPNVFHRGVPHAEVEEASIRLAPLLAGAGYRIEE